MENSKYLAVTDTSFRRSDTLRFLRGDREDRTSYSPWSIAVAVETRHLRAHTFYYNHFIDDICHCIAIRLQHFDSKATFYKIVPSLNTSSVDILGLNAGLALGDVGLSPSVFRSLVERRWFGFVLCLLFDADGFDLNESSGVGGLKATELVHGRLLLVVETLETSELTKPTFECTCHAPPETNGLQQRRCPCTA